MKLFDWFENNDNKIHSIEIFENMMFDKRFDFSVYLHIELRNFEIKCTCGVIKSFIFLIREEIKEKSFLRIFTIDS